LVAIIASLLSAAGGVGLWSFLTKRLEIGAHKEEREQGQLRSDHKECLERVQRLEALLTEALRRLEVVEHHHSSSMPRWIKNAGKRIIWANSAAMLSIFARVGYSRADVVGRTFAELLDGEASAEIDRMDRAALALPGKAVSTILQLHLSLPPMVVVKVASAGRDGEVIYEGYAYCPNDPVDEQKRGDLRQREQLGASTLMLVGPQAEDTPNSAT
jgi:hypothetical protein